MRHDERGHVPEVIRRLTNDQLKFVIRRARRLAEVARYLAELRGVVRPQAIEREPLREKSVWIRHAAQRRGWRSSPRLHIELFGNTRGT